MPPTATAEATRTILGELIPLDRLFESPLNPRKTFNPETLAELAASIREKGVLEPLIVRQHAHASDAPHPYEIIAGARRYRASLLADQVDAPCIIREYTDAQVVEIMAIENGQRDEVAPLEEAAGYKALLGIDKGYSVAMIAHKIGRSEKFVWDRLKLLDLVPEAKRLLEAGSVGIEHAEILSKLKPVEQQRAIDLKHGGLFVPDYALEFDPHAPESGDKYARVKVASVREFRQWIARNIRFDLAHAAAAAPLEFGPVADKVKAVIAEEGVRKVIPITFEHHVRPEAQSDERTYTVVSWRKAENKNGEPTCDHAVLGVVSVGEHYGETFRVCVAREKCKTHFGKEIAKREKNQKLRETGQGKAAAKREASAHERQQETWRREQEREAAERTRWEKLERPAVAAVVKKLKPGKVTDGIARAVILRLCDHYSRRRNIKTVETLLGRVRLKNFTQAIELLEVLGHAHTLKTFTKCAKRYGVDVVKLEKALQPAKKVEAAK